MIATALSAALAGLHGCGALLSPSSLVSLGTSIVGGVANGSIMGGSVLGALREDTPADIARGDAQSTANRDAVQPLVNGVPESPCISLEATARGMPCS